MSYDLDVEIGKLKDVVTVSVVDADIPFLLGIYCQSKWNMVLDIARKELYIGKTDETFKIQTSRSNHWRLPIQTNKTLHKEAHNLVYKVDINNMSDSKLKRHVMKVHKNLCHKSENQMTSLFSMAGNLNTRVRKTIIDVVNCCSVCKRFKKTPPRPSVAISKATTNNEVISVDLKEKREYGKYILYICDEFSGYVAGVVIPNKLPDTIIEAFHRRWVREGPGIPKKGIFSDRGGEFRNAKMEELASKYGIRLNFTAAHSPWSNGKNKRNHYSCDRTIES